MRSKQSCLSLSSPKLSEHRVHILAPFLTYFLSNLVRHSAARVVAAIASIEFTEGTWPELLPFLHQSCTSPVVAHREVGSYILFTVLENIVEGFQEHLQNLFKLFAQLLVDQSPEVRITTVRFVSAWTDHLISPTELR